MHKFPQLSDTAQRYLPQLIADPVPMPSKFVDSTHQLWHCDTAEGAMVLKVCDHDSIVKSPFWFAMNHLFNADFPNSLAEIEKTHQMLKHIGSIQVPDYVASCANQFVLTRFVVGEDVDAKQLTHEMIIQFALHIGHLHQHHYSHWGALHAPFYKACRWSECLHKTLLAMLETSHVSTAHPMVQTVLDQVLRIEETDFVPMMLDLRWDQFRVCQSVSQADQLVLIDLDAFVIGPPALILVLIEYLLTAEQMRLFKATYTTLCDWPEMTLQKPAYQLLLFLMHALGETDLEKWMTDI